MQHLDLLSSIGLDHDNDPEDISNAATALITLGRWGALDAARTGEHDDASDREIRSYQSENDLEPDGVLLPSGPTQAALNRALVETPLGPSLLERVSGGVENADTAVVPRPSRINIGGRNSALQSRLDQKPGRVPHVASLDSGELPHISERASRAMDAAARMQRKAQAAINWSGTLRNAPPSAGDIEQIMIGRGFRYLPDPMGRVGEGDWIDAAGRRVDADEAARTAREPAQSIPQGSRNFTSAFDAASHRIAVPKNPRPLSVPTSGSPNVLTDHDVARINGALREVVVANALRFRATAPDELAKVVARSLEDQAIGPRDNRSRIHDMLLQASETAASPDERLHARGLLSVYRMEMEEAKRRSVAQPSAVADRALTHFIADQSGQVAWSVFRTEDEDDVEIIEASDDPDKSGSKKPRGMANPKSSEAAKDGYRRHEQQLRPYVDQKGPGWRYGEGIKDPKTGTYVYPDVTTPRNRTMEMKPDTSTGRAAGAKQIERYERATGERSRVFTYREFATPPRPPNAADEKGGRKWVPSPPRGESGQVGAAGRAPSAARSAPPPRIVGGGTKLYPKVMRPIYLQHLWEILE